MKSTKKQDIIDIPAKIHNELIYKYEDLKEELVLVERILKYERDISQLTRGILRSDTSTSMRLDFLERFETSTSIKRITILQLDDIRSKNDQK